MKRVLDGGLELDDDKARVDRDEVHRFLSDESYCCSDYGINNRQRRIRVRCCLH